MDIKSREQISEIPRNFCKGIKSVEVHLENLKNGYLLDLHEVGKPVGYILVVCQQKLLKTEAKELIELFSGIGHLLYYKTKVFHADSSPSKNIQNFGTFFLFFLDNEDSLEEEGEDESANYAVNCFQYVVKFALSEFLSEFLEIFYTKINSLFLLKLRKIFEEEYDINCQRNIDASSSNIILIATEAPYAPIKIENLGSGPEIEEFTKQVIFYIKN